MARLAGTDTTTVQADRVGTAERYAREHGVVVVLKGAETVVAASGSAHAHRYAISRGPGDGRDRRRARRVIGSLLAQGLPARDAAIAGVTIHAEAGLMVQARRGRAGALASDLIEALPAAQERLRQALEAATARR